MMMRDLSEHLTIVQGLLEHSIDTHPLVGNGNGSPCSNYPPHNFSTKESQKVAVGERVYRCPMCGREYPFSVEDLGGYAKGLGDVEEIGMWNGNVEDFGGISE
jgi:hypothetical protein